MYSVTLTVDPAGMPQIRGARIVSFASLFRAPLDQAEEVRRLVEDADYRARMLAEKLTQKLGL